MRIVTAKLYVGSGLEPEDNTPPRFRRHRTVIDPREILPTVENIVGESFPGSTIIKGRGRWQGRGEPSLVVELWREASKAEQFFLDVTHTARKLAEALDQVSVAAVTTGVSGQTNVSYFGVASGDVGQARRRKHRGGI